MPLNIFNTFNDPSALAGATQAYGVNDGDQIVGYYQDATGNHGYLLSGGVFTTSTTPRPADLMAPLRLASMARALSSAVTVSGPSQRTASSTILTAAAVTPPSTLPWASAAPLRSV
jgi:hypothetical protein